MAELVLQASNDLVARLAHEGDPVRAVVELVWNAIDAEASKVIVRLERDETTEAIRAVRVQDDGHGISSDEVEATFGRIGDSWKKVSRRSKNDKRRLHGSRGEGRLRAFALGSRVVWSSYSINTAGVLQHVEIEGSRIHRHVFRWTAETSSEVTTGTTVTGHNDQQLSLAALENDAALTSLRSHFAPILLHDPGLAIMYDGASLDPTQEIVDDAQLTVPFGDGNRGGELSIRVIEWRSGNHRAIYYGPDEHHFPVEEPGRDVEGQYSFSAYITWDGLNRLVQQVSQPETYVRTFYRESGYRDRGDHAASPVCRRSAPSCLPSGPTCGATTSPCSCHRSIRRAW